MSERNSFENSIYNAPEVNIFQKIRRVFPRPLAFTISCEYTRGVNQKAANVHGARFCEESSHREGALLGCESQQLFTPIKYKVTEKVHARKRALWTRSRFESTKTKIHSIDSAGARPLGRVDTMNVDAYDTALRFACQNGHEQYALELLKWGADPNKANNNGCTALMKACENGHEQCALALIKAGANPEAQMNSGHTALMLSCQNGYERCALALIKAGAALDHAENNGFTALMLACANGHEQCALELIKTGAAVDAHDEAGWTALMLAAETGHEQCARALIKAGAAVDKTNNNGWTALMFAAQEGHEQCALELIKTGAAVDATDGAGWTALMFAAEIGHEQCVMELIKAGAEIEAQSLDGYSALMLAAENGHKQCALTLLRANASIDVDWSGVTDPDMLALIESKRRRISAWKAFRKEWMKQLNYARIPRNAAMGAKVDQWLIKKRLAGWISAKGRYGEGRKRQRLM